MSSWNGRRRERIAWAVAVLLVCGGVVAVGWSRASREAGAVVEREEAAKRLLREVRAEELRHRERSGSFGWLEDLTSTPPPSPGYRVDVLLPRDRLGERVLLTARREGGADPELSKRHFAAVARPIEPGVGGYRSWYVDERGELFFSEGVMDLDALLRGALPQWVVRGEMGRETAAPIFWQRAHETWE